MTKIAIAGAGSIGCYVGGLLAASGHEVSMIGRPKLQEEVTAFGLCLTDLDGLSVEVPPEELRFGSVWHPLADAELILVCVKSSATTEVALEIAKHAPKTSHIVSLQNGVNNADALRNALPDHLVYAGMVGFNVVRMGEGRFHRGTSGDILIGPRAEEVAAIMSVPGLDVQAVSDIEAVLWGKLVLNLNNALNALSGIPLKTQLETAGWRRILAAQISEALRLLKTNGIKAKPINGVPLPIIPGILKLPNPLFGFVARKMLAIDPDARSSMWEDFQAGRPTEIDEFQGQLINLAAKSGQSAPVSTAVSDLVRMAETEKNGSPQLTAAAVSSAIA